MLSAKQIQIKYEQILVVVPWGDSSEVLSKQNFRSIMAYTHIKRNWLLRKGHRPGLSQIIAPICLVCAVLCVTIEQ